MTGRPRRTADIPTSSVKKAPQASARKSRIAQPQFHARTTSMDRVSVAPGSAMKLRGITPSRQPPQTPQTPTYTPMSRTKLTMTAEKEDRALMAGYQKRILDYMAETNIFTDIKQLRAMTFKHFLAVCGHLLQKIGDKRFKVENVDDIYKAVTELEYPFTVNKSWLKTPTAGHAFTHILVMLNWLVEMIDTESQLEFIFDSEYPSVEYQKEFFHRINAGFRLWDQRKDDEFELLKEELVDCILQETAHVSTKQIMAENIRAMRDEKEILAATVKPCEDAVEQQDVEMQVQKLTREIKALEFAIQQGNDEKSTLRKTLAENIETLKVRVAESNALQNQVRKQQMTVDEKQQLIEENFNLKIVIAAQEKQLKHYEDNDCPITVSRLQNEKCQKVIALNRLIYEIAKQLPSVDPNVYEINPKSDEHLQSDLKIVDAALKTFTADLDEVTAAKSAEKIQKMQKKVQLEAKLKEKVAQLEEMQGKVMKNEGKLNERMEKIMMEIESLSVEDREVQQKVEEVKEEIAATNAALNRNAEDTKQIEAETQVLMEKFLRDARAMRDEQRKNVAQVDGLIKEAKVEGEYLQAQTQMLNKKLQKLQM